MLSFLEQLRNGSIESRSFQIAETTRRVLSLELSNFRDLERSHAGGVNTIDIETVENRYLLSGGTDGTIFIHDLYNLKGNPQYTCNVACRIDKRSGHAHSFSVGCVQWYPFDTGLFTSTGMDHQLRVWDANSQKPVEIFRLDTHVNGHHMSSVATQHSLVAVAVSHPRVILVDLRSGSYTHELRGHHGKVRVVRWSPHEEYLLATGGTDQHLLLWDVRCAKGYLRSLDQYNGKAMGNQNSVITAHNGAVNSLCFTPDGLYLVSCGTDNKLHLWDVARSENTLVNYGKVSNKVFRIPRIDMCYASKPGVLFVPSGGSVEIFDLFTGEKLNTLVGHFNTVNCCAFRSTYHELYTGGNDRNILVWTPDTEQEAAYEEYLRKNVGSDKKVSRSFIKRTNLTENWSSDED
ncbi:DNA excision repair protein ERCC-8-like [Centruroides vittatus]|uniref:DNA excision repair protein ERCC-8-like n=1 Tax=Centruroides vittatus TaxID=120091 RepID=UPI00350F15AC